jgi:alpha-galactosidase
MTFPTKIAVIGAGSASFGENTLSALLRSKKLRGSTLALVDKNARSLDIIHRLANRLNAEWDARFTINSYVHHKDALEDAEFVVSAIEVGPREQLWKSDFEIPLKYGVRQPYAENGGPAGFAHAARNIGPLMEIVGDMEEICPDAWLINYTNPMTRICDAVNRYSHIRAVGLCHQVYIGYVFVGLVLAHDLKIKVPAGLEGMHADFAQHVLREQVLHQVLPRVELTTAGLNHFTWILYIRDRETGENLYPLFRQRYASFDPQFEPLTREIFNTFDLFPVPGDTHLSEYLPWVSDSKTKPWEKYNIRLYDWDVWAGLRDFSLDRLNDMADGRSTIDGLLETDSEGALEMIENIAGNGSHYHPAANRPNIGQIANLPFGATVETPVHVSSVDVKPIHVGALPEPIAELLRREITVGQLCVDAAVEGSREKALQSLLLDPMITDFDIAKKILDDFLKTYKIYLPQFWQ